jgi:hypothetical protein
MIAPTREARRATASLSRTVPRSRKSIGTRRNRRRIPVPRRCQVLSTTPTSW